MASSSMKSVTEGWLAAASDDILLIERIIDDDRLSHLAGFHAQQAIEKCLKAILEHRGQPVPKVHSLNRLIELCGLDLNSAEADLVSALDGLYLDARYPGALGLLPEGKPTGHEVRTFLEFASAIFRRSKEIVQRDDHCD